MQWDVRFSEHGHSQLRCKAASCSSHQETSIMPARRIHFLVLGLLFPFACATTTPLVQRLDPAAPGSTTTNLEDIGKSVAYALPRTVLRITYYASRAQFETPDCSASDSDAGNSNLDLFFTALQIQDMKKLFDDKKWKHPFSIYTLKDGALTTVSEPDPNEVFIMSMASRMFADSSLKVVIGADGTLSSSEASTRDAIAPTVAKVIEVGGAVIAEALPFAPITLLPDSSPPKKMSLTKKDLTAAKEMARMLKESLDANAALFEVNDVQLNLDTLNFRGVGCRAKAIRYMQLEGQRQDLLAMKVSHAKDAYELRLNELRGAQDAIRAAFLGLKRTASASIVCDVVPQPGLNTLPLLKISTTSGVVEDGNAECRIPQEFRQSGVAPNDNTSIVVEVIQAESAFGQLWAALPHSPRPQKAGFFYRMPGMGVVFTRTVPQSQGNAPSSDKGATALAIPPQRVTIAQFGRVVAYPRVSGSNPKIAFELYPDTGALKSLLVEEHSADTSTLLGSLGGATTTVLAAEKALRDAADAKKEKTANEELVKLQREQGILEATLAIGEARKALGL
jgi:hypothetical protein